ncbi:MAG: M1 family peptidase [Bacteroidetes bacterium]|nr:M1 family peptidase [Bacteroidota bacterium]
MKTILLSLALVVTIFSHGQNTGPIDVLHYSFSIELSDESDIINCKALVQVRFTDATDRFNLDLTSVKQGKGMNVISTTEKGRPITITHQDNILSFQLSTKAKVGDTSVFEINYNGIPSDGLIISKNKYGNRTFFADNWPNRGHNWIPCHDDPSDKATVEYIVTAPQHYQVVANGIQVEETNLDNNKKLSRYVEDVPIATKVMVIGAADFAVNLSGFVGCIPVYSWVYPEERNKGFYDYAQANDILPFFIANVGPYGYKKLANVQSKTTFGGLENANTIFYYENSITGTRRSESLLTHEIAHQWFGNMATEKSFAHLWLSEGFATYFTILYFENKHGIDTALYMLKKDRREVVAFSKENNHPIVDTTVKDYMQLLNANNYQKGGWILHMLRRQLGDSAFWQSIRAYYATYAGKNADTRDLQRIFEKNSGRNLDTFFNQWLYTPGQPSLNITWKVDKNKKLLLKVSQLQTRPFVFPLELELKTSNGKSVIVKLDISKREEVFSVTAPKGVTGIITDPNTSLLFEEKATPTNQN